jgi:hypothetical protein
MSTNEQDGQRDDNQVVGLPEPYLGDRSEVAELPSFLAGPQLDIPVDVKPETVPRGDNDAPTVAGVQAQAAGPEAVQPQAAVVAGEVPAETPEVSEQDQAADSVAQAVVTPEVAPEKAEVPAEAKVQASTENPAPADNSAMDPNTLLRSIADMVVAQTKAAAQPVAQAAPVTSVSPEEMARVAQALDVSKPLRPEQLAGAVDAAAPEQPAPAAGGGTVQVGPGERVQIGGGAALAQGLGALVGGTMAVAGAAARAVGEGARSVASAIRPGDAATPDMVAGKLEQVGTGLPAVLPRLSEYRVDALEEAAAKYSAETEKFWGSSTKLTALRSEMERVARERGLSIQDVVEKMKPGGDFAELREQFNAEVSQNPDTGTRKRAMDKALDGFVRQYGRAQEELANPEQDGNAHYEGLKGRVKKAHDGMVEKAGGIPAFANADGALEQSHLERLQETIRAIMEKVREIAQKFVAMLKGNDTSSEASHEHASP